MLGKVCHDEILTQKDVQKILQRTLLLTFQCPLFTVPFEPLSVKLEMSIINTAFGLFTIRNRQHLNILFNISHLSYLM